VDLQGFDGAVNVEDYTEQARQHEVPELPTIKHANLADAADLPVADWVMSLEVGEHLPEEFTAEFLKNIHRNNRRGVIMSWALAHPWASGQGHINKRSNDEVGCLFEQLGYEFDREWSARGRNASLEVNSWFTKHPVRPTRASLCHLLNLFRYKCAHHLCVRARRRCASPLQHHAPLQRLEHGARIPPSYTPLTLPVCL